MTLFCNYYSKVTQLVDQPHFWRAYLGRWPCRQALQDRSHGQAAALAAVVQSVNFLMPVGEDSLQASDMRADPTFWALLRQLMVSRHSSVLPS